MSEQELETELTSLMNRPDIKLAQETMKKPYHFHDQPLAVVMAGIKSGEKWTGNGIESVSGDILTYRFTWKHGTLIVPVEKLEKFLEENKPWEKA